MTNKCKEINMSECCQNCSIRPYQDCLQANECKKDYNYVMCDECGAVFDFAKLPDDHVETYREYHGQPNLTPEIVPRGWTCPACGERHGL